MSSEEDAATAQTPTSHLSPQSGQKCQLETFERHPTTNRQTPSQKSPSQECVGSRKSPLRHSHQKADGFSEVYPLWLQRRLKKQIVLFREMLQGLRLRSEGQSDSAISPQRNAPPVSLIHVVQQRWSFLHPFRSSGFTSASECGK